MTSENLITFSEDDYLDDIREIMASVRHRYFPVLDNQGKYKGMISRRNLLGAKGKNLILVDHNESIQAAEGAESTNILEIIDHHRLGTISTIAPVYFRNQPLGCTSTIIYQMFSFLILSSLPFCVSASPLLCVMSIYFCILLGNI